MPSSPVAQNLQAIGHPTWVEMHTVCRPFSGIMTVSMACPSRVRKRYFLVPSVARETRRNLATPRAPPRRARPATLGQVRGLLPVPHQGTGQGEVGLLEAVRRARPAPRESVLRRADSSLSWPRII